MPKKTPKTKSPAQTSRKSAVELSEKQLEQVSGGLVIRERMEPPVK